MFAIKSMQGGCVMDRNYWDVWIDWKCIECGKEDRTRSNMMSHSCPRCGNQMVRIDPGVGEKK